MKAKAILGVVIALTLLLSLSLPAIAVKPTPVLSVGSITYTVNYDGLGNDQVEASNINWQKAHPYGIQVYLVRDSPLKGISKSNYDLPKGKAAKYPQNITSDVVTNSNYFEAGDQIEVRVRLVSRKYVYIALTGVLTTITWGTNSTWTAS